MATTAKPERPARVCQICGTRERSELRPAIIVRPVIAELIRVRHAGWDEAGWICRRDLQHFRTAHVEQLLHEEKGEVTQLEREVLQSLSAHEILASNPDAEVDSHTTPGQRWADRIAAFGGSWRFLSICAVALVVWMTLQVVLGKEAFDPYPFILLNLLLSCLAAIQAPVIMMSQNRQESRDRRRNEHDYQINLKAELEIRHLHQKMDHLLSKQWERLVEIQEIQIELISELRGKR